MLRGGLKAIIRNMTILRHWGGGWIGRDLSQGHFVLGGFFKLINLFMLAAPGLNCNRQDLVVQRVGSNSLNRDQTWAPYPGSMES